MVSKVVRISRNREKPYSDRTHTKQQQQQQQQRR